MPASDESRRQDGKSPKRIVGPHKGCASPADPRSGYTIHSNPCRTDKASNRVRKPTVRGALFDRGLTMRRRASDVAFFTFECESACLLVQLRSSMSEGFYPAPD